MNDNVHEHGNCNLCRRQGCAQIAALSQDVIRATGIALSLENKIAALEAEVQWQQEAPTWMLKHFKQAVEDSKKPHDECSTFVDPWVQRAFDAEAEVERLERQLKVYQESTIEVHSLAPFVALARATQDYIHLPSPEECNVPDTCQSVHMALAHPSVKKALES